jgi:hypothetical protein
MRLPVATRNLAVAVVVPRYARAVSLAKERSLASPLRHLLRYNLDRSGRMTITTLHAGMINAIDAQYLHPSAAWSSNTATGRGQMLFAALTSGRQKGS